MSQLRTRIYLIIKIMFYYAPNKQLESTDVMLNIENINALSLLSNVHISYIQFITSLSMYDSCDVL